MSQLTLEKVHDVLKTCYDPEIPVSILDLGLIYNVEIDGDVVNVVMTLTARGCPMSRKISADVKNRLEALPEVSRANVEIVWDPQWTPEMISPEGRRILGMD
ncbi:metal-sulfur cluster assembly factor [Fidelibacter multiformis]|jgi:metal-sulfur cluster biosynthetic enzyme|uniref:metal-sulfur cluster assembly factor n=1 Tax=Fidelibacter multiformis TaxID=3377529 RepID=UPI0037DC5D8C